MANDAGSVALGAAGVGLGAASGGIIPGLLALGTAGYQFWQGAQQKKMADKLQNSNYVPSAVQEAVDMSRQRANTSVMPGFARGLDRLRTSTANTVYNLSKTATNPNVIQQGVADADAREKEALKDMSVANESYKVNNQNQFMNALGVEGQYQKSSWDAYTGAKSALIGASMQNKFNAISSTAAGLIGNGMLPNVGFPKVNFGALFRRKTGAPGSMGVGAGADFSGAPSGMQEANVGY